MRKPTTGEVIVVDTTFDVPGPFDITTPPPRD